MIWFPCKQCGKVHGRSENSSGTLVFCECGQGNMVPWESTAAEPARPVDLPPAEASAPAAALPVVGPRLEPLKFDAVPVAAPVSSPPPPRNEPREPSSSSRDRRSQGKPSRYRPDPNFCLNHPTTASVRTCTDCREAFCAECVVFFQGEQVCGPCKNFRVRTLEVGPRLSGFALASLIVALVAGPLVFCMQPIGRSMGSAYLALGAILPQLTAFVLGVIALRNIEADPKVGGWSLALTGMLTAGVACFFTVLIVIFGTRLGV